MSKYKYKPRQTGDDSNLGEKPQDKNNHLPDALRYMLSPFPQFPPDPELFEEVWRTAMLTTTLRRSPEAYLLENDHTDEFNIDFLDNFG